MSEPDLITALIRGSPVAVAILAMGFSIWKWILPMWRELRAIDRDFESQREAARVARDAAWQASLREIGQQHREATSVAVQGFREALDRHDRAMDRYAAQHGALAADVGQIKVDLHAVVSRLTTLELPAVAGVASPPKKG